MSRLLFSSIDSDLIKMAAYDPVAKLNKLLQNKLDTFEVLSECQKLKIEIVEYMDFSCQKYLLQKSLILEILKIND